MDENRLQFLDIARGIGILMVMYGHSVYHNLDITIFITGCYIPIFFVISGYLSKGTSNGGGYFLRRQKFLLVPYFFFSLLLGVLFFVINGTIESNNIIGIFYSRFYLYPMGTTPNIDLMGIWNSPMWFLTAMSAALFFYELLLRNKAYLLVYISVYVIVVILLSKLPILLPWNLDVAPIYAIFMLIGYLIKEHNLLNKPICVYIVLFILYILSCIHNGEVNLSIREYGASIFGMMLTSIVGSVIILKGSLLLEKIKYLSFYLSLAGRYSVYILCTHVFLFSIFQHIVPVTDKHWAIVLLLLITELLFVSLCGVVIGVFLKRIAPKLFR